MARFTFDIIGFDLDGTLCDTAADLAASADHALATLGRAPLGVERLRPMIGGGMGSFLTAALEASGGIPDTGFETALTAQRDYYRNHIADFTRPYPGCEAALDALAARGVTLAVVTNKLEAFAVQLLDALGLASRFTTILGGDSLGPGRGKPAPDLLIEMVARCGGGRAAFVGDTTYDVRAARAAHLPVIACGFGYPDQPVAMLGANAVIDHFDELLPSLRDIATRL